MILTQQQNLHEQPSVTSAAPRMTVQVPLTSSGTVTPINDNSNPQQGTIDNVSPTIAVNDNPGKDQTLLAITTMEGNPPPPNQEIPPRIVSTTDEVFATSKETSPLNIPNGYHESNIANDTRKLFVGGLPTDITQPEFQSFFAQFGELQDAVVMFDRDTKCSRGFGFVTYVDPEVSKSLLQMGDRHDGIGRLVMRGKTCEVKAATPKGEAGYNGRRVRGGSVGTSNSGNAGLRTNTELHRSSHINNSPSYPYPAPMNYPLMLDPLSGSMPMHHQYPYPHGYTAYGMAHTPYYQSMHPLHHAGIYSGVDPLAGPTTASPHYYLPAYDPAAASHYQSGHNQIYAYAPVMAMNAVAGDMGSAGSIQASVMQPVAPGIPGREGELDDAINEDNNQE